MKLGTFVVPVSGPGLHLSSKVDTGGEIGLTIKRRIEQPPNLPALLPYQPCKIRSAMTAMEFNETHENNGKLAGEYSPHRAQVYCFGVRPENKEQAFVYNRSIPPPNAA